jgi:hypothetical protein
MTGSHQSMVSLASLKKTAVQNLKIKVDLLIMDFEPTCPNERRRILQGLIDGFGRFLKWSGSTATTAEENDNSVHPYADSYGFSVAKF